MNKKYTWIRIKKDAKEKLDQRLNLINNVDLKLLGLKNQKIHQIDLTDFLFKTKIFMTNNELKSLAKKFKIK